MSNAARFYAIAECTRHTVSVQRGRDRIATVELTPLRYVAYRHKGRVSERVATLVLWLSPEPDNAQRYCSHYSAFRGMANLQTRRNAAIGTEYAVVRFTEERAEVVSGAFGK